MTSGGGGGGAGQAAVPMTIAAAKSTGLDVTGPATTTLDSGGDDMPHGTAGRQVCTTATPTARAVIERLRARLSP